MLVLLSTPLRADAPASAPATYQNPLPIDIADPFVIRHEGLYWLYGTSSRQGYKCWSSADLVQWEPRGLALKRTPEMWGKMMFWAPCVVERGGKFYMYYSALGDVPGGEQHLRICVAMSDKPEGPFKDVKAPMLELGKSCIDAHVFIDGDGKSYLYYALDYSENYVDDPKGKKQQSHLYVVPLGDDLITINGKPIFCMKPEGGWEGDGWTEAPFVFKHGKTYILMYSTHAFNEPDYSVGYATASSPLGPWRRSEDNPILHRTPEVSGPGHNCVTRSPDGKELFCVYHVHKNRVPGGDRLLAMDRMEVREDSGGSVKLKVVGPTTTPQPIPR
jgi:beta-xylosidase